MKYMQTVVEVTVDDAEDTPGLVEGWAFECSAPCGFVSQGWHTEDLAKERANQHGAEHKSGEEAKRSEGAIEPELMEPISDFIAARQTGPQGAGVVRSASKGE